MLSLYVEIHSNRSSAKGNQMEKKVPIIQEMVSATKNKSGRKDKGAVFIELIKSEKYTGAVKIIDGMKNYNTLDKQKLLDILITLPEIGDKLPCINLLRGRIHTILETKKEIPGVA